MQIDETPPVRVMLAAPRPGDADALQAAVTAAGALAALRASTPDEAADALAADAADVVVASEEMDLPGLLEALGAAGRRIPVVAMVEGGEEAEETARRAGAADALPRAAAGDAGTLRRTLRLACRAARLHAEVRETRRTLSALFGSLPGMVYRCRNEPGWSMEFASHRCHELTGYRAEELTGGQVAFGALVHPEDRPAVWTQVQDAVARGVSYRLTYRIRTAAGREKWVCDEGASVPGAPGTLEGFIGDVTEQVRAEAALRESERYFRTLLECADEAAVVLAEDGTVRYASPSLSRILGTEPAALAATRLRDHASPAARPDALAFRAALEAEPGRTRVCTLAMRTAAGEERLVEIAGRSLLHDPVVRGFVLNVRDVTDQERAARQLGESEQRFKSLFDYNPDAVFSLDAEGRITSLNAAAERLAGGTAAELVGSPFHPLVDPEDLDFVSRRLASALAGEPQLYELRLRPPSARPSLVLVTNLPMVVDGAVVGVYGIAQDVTAQRAAEQLQRLHDRALASVGEGIVITDATRPDNPIVSVNSAFERLTGYAAEEVMGRNCRFLQGPATDPVAVARMEAAVRGGVPCSVEIINYRKDGDLFWNEVSLAPVPDERGRVTHHIGVLNDVTQRRERKEALRTREAHFRSLIENAQDIITVLEGDGTVRFASPAVERVLGHRQEEMEGLDLLTLVHPDDLETVEGALGSAIYHPGAPQWLELRVRHRDGGWRVLETVGTSLLHNPAVMGIVLNARDVTERRQAEEALAASRMQFLQAQKMEAVGRLAGGVAHDFNNLLTAIRGNADLLLLDLAEGNPAREDVLEIRRASDRAAGLTRQLLAFSRRQVLQPRVLSLNDVVGEMQRMLTRLITAQVQMSTRLDPALGSTLADAGQVEQVVVNLAVNARDAMPGGGELTVETANAELGDETTRRYPYVVPGPYVMLRVSDTGTGMDRATRDSAFEPFFTTKGAGQGTGLGLSTVYGIVKQTGGYVWLDSEPGRGTTVTVYLPRVEERGPAEQQGEAQGEQAAPVRGETVLVVEDEVAVRNLAGRVLGRAGYRVQEAQDGFEALRLAETGSDPIHLLLTDVSMPRMGGRELARRVREVRPGTRVLFFSGDAGALEATDPGELCVAKPFGPESLLRAVREALDAPPLPEAAPPPPGRGPGRKRASPGAPRKRAR